MEQNTCEDASEIRKYFELKKKTCQRASYLDFSFSVCLLFLVASKSTGIGVHNNRVRFVFAGPFFRSALAIVTATQIGIFTRTTLRL